MKVCIVFPHQLFEQSSLLNTYHQFYLVEEFLLFKQYSFHKQKIAFHRCSMKFYADYLKSLDKEVHYIDSFQEYSDIQKLLVQLRSLGYLEIGYIDPCDCWLEKRISLTALKLGLTLNKFDSPSFLNSAKDISTYFQSKSKFLQHDFYKNQRIKHKILIDSQLQPQGGQWSFDQENRLNYPKNKVPPKIKFPAPNLYYKEALNYTTQYFPNNLGDLDASRIYPTSFKESKEWFQKFLSDRFLEFGKYEDAMVSNEKFLHHSVLTPMLNSGLITPKYIVDETLSYAQKHSVPLNSLEGFIRQILGWREFIRGVYIHKGSLERTTNFWKFKRKIPSSFWTGTTGIDPVDITIHKLLQTGYTHHIERLMVLGNFMLLCEFDPDEVYRWFMEFYIDSYDWVMVPNVYGMSQFADGGLMATKPYISGSNYLLKMSNFPKGPWQKTWDGLFWRFMHVHRNFFLKNPRLGMLVKTFDKMDTQKQSSHLKEAQRFLDLL